MQSTHTLTLRDPACDPGPFSPLSGSRCKCAFRIKGYQAFLPPPLSFSLAHQIPFGSYRLNPFANARLQPPSFLPLPMSITVAATLFLSNLDLSVTGPFFLFCLKGPMFRGQLSGVSLMGAYPSLPLLSLTSQGTAIRSREFKILGPLMC